MLNHIVLMGRLTKDPELRRTQSGLPVTSFTLACDRDFAPKDGGERQTDFVDIVAWRSTAEFVSKYFSKGRMAVVSGRLQMRDWQDQNGNKRRATEIVADNVYFGDSKRDGDGGRNSDQQSGYPPQGAYPQGGWYPQGNSQGGYGYPAPPAAPAQSSQPPRQQPNYYPPSNYGGFSDVDDDGDLPF